jgi:hypothetical protein
LNLGLFTDAFSTPYIIYKLVLNGRMKFQLLTAASMKITVFWDVAPYSLVEVYRRFKGAYCLHHQGDRPVSTFRTEVAML